MGNTDSTKRSDRFERDFEVPPQIRAMAWEIAIWAAKNGWCDWVIGPIADANLIWKLEEKCKKIKRKK